MLGQRSEADVQPKHINRAPESAALEISISVQLQINAGVMGRFHKLTSTQDSNTNPYGSSVSKPPGWNGKCKVTGKPRHSPATANKKKNKKKNHKKNMEFTCRS